MDSFQSWDGYETLNIRLKFMPWLFELATLHTISVKPTIRQARSDISSLRHCNSRFLGTFLVLVEIQTVTRMDMLLSHLAVFQRVRYGHHIHDCCIIYYSTIKHLLAPFMQMCVPGVELSYLLPIIHIFSAQAF